MIRMLTIFMSKVLVFQLMYNNFFDMKLDYQGISREHQGNLRKTSGEPLGNLRGTTGEHQGNLGGTSGEPQRNISGTSGEP